MAQGGLLEWDVQRDTDNWNEKIKRYGEKYFRVILKREIDPAKLVQAINHSGWKPKSHEKEEINKVTSRGYEDLDASVLYTLIRNVTRLSLPSRGWGKEPDNNHVTESDDIERIRALRNDVIHKKNMSHLFYLESFKTLSSILERVLSRTPSVPFQDDLKCLKELVSTLEKSTAPSKPKDEGSTASSINISWVHRSDPNIDYVAGYEIYYKRVYGSDRTNRWLHVCTKDRRPKFTIRRLKSHTEYVFKVRALYNQGGNDTAGPFGQESECIKTKETPANKITQHCTKLLDTMDDGSSIQYHEVLLEEKVVKNFLRIRRLDPQVDIGQNSCLDSKTLLLVGTSSSEKSAVINAVLNFMYDVSFHDEFRLMVDRGEAATPGALCISRYVFPRLHGAKTKFCVNIVDIPCLTGDKKRDSEIIQLVELYYDYCKDSSAETIDLIGYVMPESHMQTVEPDQEYILRCVLGIFGSDLKSIIHIIQTSSSPNESQRSPVVKALHDLQIFCRQFRFNNTWLRSNNEEIAHNYWEMSARSFHDLSVQLQRTRPKTFVQSQEALKMLNIMKHIFWSPHPFLRTCINKLISLGEEKKMIQNFAEAGANVVPILECYVEESWDDNNDSFCFNCTICKVSCLYPCYEDSTDSSHLGIINRIDQTCQMCGCPLAKDNESSHKFERKFYRLELKKELKTLGEVKEKYKIEDIRNLHQHITKLKSDHGAFLHRLMHEIDKKVKLFQEKSSRSHVVPIENAIDCLVQEEQFEISVGTNERIRLYSILKRKEMVSD